MNKSGYRRPFSIVDFSAIANFSSESALDVMNLILALNANGETQIFRLFTTH
jgi:hypothetical protein